MMQIIDCEQNSDLWYSVRNGKVTASRFSDVLAKGAGKTRKDYLYDLAAERLTGKAERFSFKSKDMEHGQVTEAQAREEYSLWTGNDFKRVGFCVLNDDVGASPDSLVGDDGLLEVKSPKTTTQIESYLKKEMPSKHVAQVQGQLWVTGRQWCDFVSFDPDILTPARFLCIRIFRDEDYIKNLEIEVNKFVADLETLMQSLK